MPKILALTGCTASGKSALALELARELSGEIVCMDSMQIYRRMDIGTAKPTREEQMAVPHHLLDIVEPEESYGVADYVRDAEKAFAEIWNRGRLPVLVGGTGLYLKALLHGLALGAEKSDPELRARLEKEALAPGGREKLHQALERVDPFSAARLHPNDLRRVIRALEVYQLSGVPLSRQNQDVRERPYQILPFCLRMNRQELFDRIQRRVEKMLEQGLLEEVRELLQSGVPLSAQSMQAIGYKELAPVALGRASLSDAAEQLALHTRHYAKRQETWFLGEKSLRWLEAGASALPAASLLAREFLNQPGD